jgi:hypothetical protein
VEYGIGVLDNIIHTRGVEGGPLAADNRGPLAVGIAKLGVGR